MCSSPWHFEVDDLPLGDVRAHWAPEQLRLRDLEAADYRERVGDQVKEALRELLASLNPAAEVCDFVTRLSLDLNLALACLRLGILPESRVHEVATDALLQGMDSASLRRLAGAMEPTGALLSDLADAIAGVGIQPPTVADALRDLGVAIAERIVQGHVVPIDGAAILFHTHVRHHDVVMVELHPFIYAYSEWDDRPEDHALFETMILQGARDLLAARSR